MYFAMLLHMKAFEFDF